MTRSGNERIETNELRSAVSGGWNTADSDLMTPLEDSPDMLNTAVDFDGMVYKRRGYFSQFNRSTSNSFVRGSFLIPYTTSTGRLIFFTRELDSINIFTQDIDNSWFVTAMIAFGTNGPNNRVSWTILKEPVFDRIILVRFGGVPIQITIGAGRGSHTRVGTGTSWSVLLPVYTSESNTYLFFINGKLESSTTPTFSYSASGHTATFTSTNSYAAGTYSFEWVQISWQWWAEALMLTGNQIVSSVIQGTSTNNVAVPPALLRNIQPIKTNDGWYPLSPRKSTQYDDILTYNINPTTTSQFVFSAGTGSSTTLVRPTPSPYYISIGGSLTAARGLYIVRGYNPPFYGGAGFSLDNGGIEVMSLYSQETWTRYNVIPPSGGGAGVGTTKWGYHLNDKNFSFMTTVSTGRHPAFIMLTDTSTANGGIGFQQDDTYIITDVNAPTTGLEANGFVSNTNVEQTVMRWNNSLVDTQLAVRRGAAYPIGGLYNYCDYQFGSFPSVVSKVQGRVALGGFLRQPLTIAFSNAYDSVTPGYFNNVFQPEYEEPSETSSFDLTLPGGGDDFITAMLEFADNLFVFTRYRTYRIHGGGQPINYATVQYAPVAEVGAANSWCVASTNQFPVVLNGSGVYAIVPSDTSAGYAVQELSGKIRNYIRTHNTTLGDVGFLIYDPGRNELYAGLSDNVHSDRIGELLVLNMDLGAWYRYTERGGTGFHAWGGAIAQRSAGQPEVYMMIHPTWNSTNVQGVVRMNWGHFFDQHNTITYSGTFPINTEIDVMRATITTSNNVLEYDPNQPSFDQRGVRLSPILDYQDCVVSLNGVTLTFGTEYVKTAQGTILLTTNPGAGQTLVIEPRNRYEGGFYFPIGLVRVSDEKLFTHNNYTIDVSSNKYRITGITPTPTVGDQFYVGTTYPSWHFTPTFNRNTLHYKRLKHYISYYQNDLTNVMQLANTSDTSLIGTRKTRLNANISVLFSNEQTGVTQTEVYNDPIPTVYPNQQRKQYSRIIIPIVGGGYNVQVVHHSRSSATFKLSGYELDMTRKQGKGYSRTEESLY